MKTKMAYLIVIIAVMIAGCRKDDYQEIIVPCVGVETVTPPNGATGVPLNQTITITFNEEMSPNIDCDPEPYFILSNGLNQIKGTVSVNGRTAIFIPSEELLPKTTYTAIVTTKFKNMSGLSLPENFKWSFTTITEHIKIK